MAGTEASGSNINSPFQRQQLRGVRFNASEEEREGDVFSDFWLRHNVGGDPIN